MSSPGQRPAPFKRYDVCIRGGGIVGQTLALLLARERLRVGLVCGMRPPAQLPDVRAYALNPVARELLQSLRVWPSDLAAQGSEQSNTLASVTPVRAMHVWGDDGGALCFDAAAQGCEALNWIVDVPALEERLNQAVDFQSGIERLAAPAPAALTVICEGKRSTTRDELGLEFDTRAYPHKALAARVRCEQAHAGIARQWFAQGEILALLPLDGASGERVALVWSLPSEQADAWLRAEPDALAAAVQSRCGNALGPMTLEGPAQTWPLELSRARRWISRSSHGSFALAGDAAHAMHPLAGQGLNVGLADAAELAQVLRDREYWRDLGDLKLLRRYERARQADVQAFSWLTDGLFGLFAQDDTRVQAVRNWGMNGVNRLGPLKHWLARQAMGPTG